MTATMREISPGNVHMNYFRVLLQHLTQPSCVYTQTLISRLSYFRMQMASPTQVLPLQSNCSNCSSDWPDTGSPSACWGRHFWPGHTHKGTWKHQDHGLHTRDCITTLSTQIPAQPRLCRQSHEHQSSPYIIDTPCRFKCFERFPPLINSLSLLFPSILRDCDDSMKESLAATLGHLQGCCPGVGQAKGREAISWGGAQQPRAKPTRGGSWTICGSCGRGQHVAKAVDLPGTSPSIPTWQSSRLAVVVERQRWSLLAPTGQQSVDRVQAIAHASWGGPCQRPATRLLVTD